VSVGAIGLMVSVLFLNRLYFSSSFINIVYSELLIYKALWVLGVLSEAPRRARDRLGG